MLSGYWVAMCDIKITAFSPRTNEAQASRATLATEQETLSKAKQQQHNKQPLGWRERSMAENFTRNTGSARRKEEECK